MNIDTFRSARPDDAEAIARLVNQAFRPRTGIAGDRIDPAPVRRLAASDHRSQID